MDMQEKYGVTGEAMFKLWENKYAKIQKDVKFGNADPEEAFHELKKEISLKVNECFEKREKRKKLAWILTALAPVMMLIGVGISGMESEPGFGLFLALVGIVLPVWGFKSIKSFEKTIIAAADFDEKYFDGQIFYYRKNGIAL